MLLFWDRFRPATLDWQPLIPLPGPAAAAVSRYDGMLAAVPSATVLLSRWTMYEASYLRARKWNVLTELRVGEGRRSAILAFLALLSSAEGRKVF